MAVRPIGGYDPNTGWPPDDSTGLPWQSDTALPGQFQGGGAGFGPGGFQGSPKLTAPASGPPPGTSLSIGGAPTNAAGMSPHIDPTTGQPEMLTGPGGLVEKTRGALNPFGFLGGGNPYWRGAIAAGGVLSPTQTANDAAPTDKWFQKPSGVGGMPGPQVTNPPQPDHPSTMRYPSWPTPPAPTGVDATIPPFTARGQPSRPATPTPATAYPASPVATPAAAGPAAARQRPNLGNYGPFTTVSRPNANPGIGGGMLGGNSGMANIGGGGARGAGGAPTMTALDLSRLFSRQQ